MLKDEHEITAISKVKLGMPCARRHNVHLKINLNYSLHLLIANAQLLHFYEQPSISQVYLA